MVSIATRRPCLAVQEITHIPEGTMATFTDVLRLSFAEYKLLTRCEYPMNWCSPAEHTTLARLSKERYLVIYSNDPAGWLLTYAGRTVLEIAPMLAQNLTRSQKGLAKVLLFPEPFHLTRTR